MLEALLWALVYIVAIVLVGKAVVWLLSQIEGTPSIAATIVWGIVVIACLIVLIRFVVRELPPL